MGQKPQFKTEIISCEGSKFEVRQSSLKDRSDTIKLVSNADGVIDSEKLMITVLINHVYVPDTDEKVFELADSDSLMSQPAGGIIDRLGQTALRLFNIDIETARKN